MMLRLFYALFSLTALLFMLNSCKHDVPVAPPAGNNVVIIGGTQPCSSDTVYFVNKVLPMIVQNCSVVGCHDAITKQDGIQLTNYEMIINSGEVRSGRPDDTKLYEILNKTGDKRMPKQVPLVIMLNLHCNKKIL